MRLAASALAIAVAITWTHAASAASFTVTGFNFPGQTTAEVDFDFDGVETLTVKIKNTSSLESSITAFVFNILDAFLDVSPGSFTVTGDVLSPPWSAWSPSGDAPFGYGAFDVVANAQNVNSDVDGDPFFGIQNGQEATFTFILDSADGRTTADFLNDTNQSSETDPTFVPISFGVRWEQQDIIDQTEVSDFGGNGGTSVIPTPAAAGAGLILLGLMAARRRRG